MPVVINDFEVVTEPATQRAETPPDASAPAPLETPDIEPMLAEHHARRRRVRAY